MISGPLGHHSIKRKLASIRFFIGISELPDPWKHSKLFTKFVSGQLKQKPAAQKQAKPLKMRDVVKLNRTLELNTLLGLRDAALINVALDTLFRASNIVDIELNHIDWDAKTIFSPKSKTDQWGEGFDGYISDETAGLLKRWIEKANILEGFLFRKLSPKQTVQAEPMQYQALLKRYAAVGMALDKKGAFTCHSTRTGGELTMMEAGVPMADIVPFLEKFTSLVAVFWAGWSAKEDNFAKYNSAPLSGAIEYSRSASVFREKIANKTVSSPPLMVVSESDSVIDAFKVKEYFNESFVHPDNRLIIFPRF
ncbi:tyrosine-type recombinase/integrase [Paraglaciecola mesophila]|nr:tyrosine-type recombinase/integrase [Paraglaciecola mesophila]